MGMQLLTVQRAVEYYKQSAYQNEASFLDHIRSSAARQLAETILEDAAIYRRIDPTEEERVKNPMSCTYHRWSIGIERDMSELEARKQQMGEARRKGILEAAASLRQQANQYEKVEGYYKPVIMRTLRDAAASLEKLSGEASE